MKLEPYRGMYIDPIRVGTKGEWAAKYGCGDFWQTTKRFSGKGAKSKAINQAMEDIEKWTPGMIEDYLHS